MASINAGRLQMYSESNNFVFLFFTKSQEELGGIASYQRTSEDSILILFSNSVCVRTVLPDIPTGSDWTSTIPDVDIYIL